MNIYASKPCSLLYTAGIYFKRWLDLYYCSYKAMSQNISVHVKCSLHSCNIAQTSITKQGAQSTLHSADRFHLSYCYRVNSFQGSTPSVHVITQGMLFEKNTRIFISLRGTKSPIMFQPTAKQHIPSPRSSNLHNTCSIYTKSL